MNPDTAHDFDLKTSHVIPALIRKCLLAKQNGKGRGDGTDARFLCAADGLKQTVRWYIQEMESTAAAIV